MSSQVLGQYLDEFAVPGLLLTFLYVMCVKAISTTGLINIGLAGMSIKQHKKFIDLDGFDVLRATALIAIINMALIITKVFVLSGRYVLALAFILMIFAAFYLADLFKYLSSHNTKYKWLVSALIIIMLLGVVKNVLPKQKGYNYQQEAITWLQLNNSENKYVFYDEARMRYYAGENFIGTWGNNWAVLQTSVTDQTINKYDYLMINITKKQAAREIWIRDHLKNFAEVKRFYDAKAKKSVVIYQKNE